MHDLRLKSETECDASPSVDTSAPREGNSTPTIQKKTPRTAARKRVMEKLRKYIPELAKERRAVFAKNAEYCRLCILDAFQGRLSNGLANNSKKSWWIYTIFRVQTSEMLFRAVMGACVFHTFSIFFEPENACTNSVIYTGLQMLVLAIYVFDISLKMSYEGIEVRNPQCYCNILSFQF